MMIIVMISSYYDDADNNADDTQGRKLAAECSRTTRRSLKLGWPPGENIINDNDHYNDNHQWHDNDDHYHINYQ